RINSYYYIQNATMATPQQVPMINYSYYPLKDIPAPHDHDVLCGRGGGTNNHSKSFLICSCEHISSNIFAII
ncbi:MAG: hypothetical protein ACI90V_005007, partial [Bacillariaceae sp.]